MKEERNGLYKVYDLTGQFVICEAIYKNGLIDGWFKEYNCHGELINYSNYKNGIRSGFCRDRSYKVNYYYEVECYLDNDLFEGEMVYFL